MPALILEFASDKAHLIETEDSILTVLRRHVGLDLNSHIPQPERRRAWSCNEHIQVAAATPIER